MPLEGLIEQWASLAQEATTPQMSKAVSSAFAAFSYEQEALQSYHLAVHEDPPCLPRPSLLASYELALDELQQGAKAWTSVAYMLESEVRSQRDPGRASTLATLVIEALTHSQRLSCIAHVVRTEQQARYQQSVKQQPREVQL